MSVMCIGRIDPFIGSLDPAAVVDGQAPQSGMLDVFISYRRATGSQLARFVTFIYEFSEE